jgi:hypothetical protein
MLTKALLFTVIAACGIHPAAASDPPGFSPPPTAETYWCCDAIVDHPKGRGTGCNETTASGVILCDKVLHCTNGYTYDDGKVTCL